MLDRPLARRLAESYVSALHAAAVELRDDPVETVLVEDDPRILRVLDALTRRRGYVVGETNAFQEIVAAAGEGSSPRAVELIRGFMRRDLVDHFAFGVPDARAIAALVGLSPVVEIGAGGGYWARCVTEAGGRIAAYDAHDPRAKGSPIRRVHHPVAVAPVSDALAREDARTLLLCWPPAAPPDPFGGRTRCLGELCLDAFRGDTVVFVGERSSHFGTPPFFRRLDREFTVTADIDLPTLPPWHDTMQLLKRK